MRITRIALVFSFLLACLPFGVSAVEERAKSIELNVAQSARQELQLNLNSTDETALMQGLKGIGQVKARAIIEYRKAHGPFVSIDQLLEVKGIGQSLLDRNRDWLVIE